MRWYMPSVTGWPDSQKREFLQGDAGNSTAAREPVRTPVDDPMLQLASCTGALNRSPSRLEKGSKASAVPSPVWLTMAVNSVSSAGKTLLAPGT